MCERIHSLCLHWVLRPAIYLADSGNCIAIGSNEV
jgi:hypothetical protein